MYKKIFFSLLVFSTSITMQAQENLGFGQRKEIIYPEIHADNSVTFRLLAPLADSVSVTGDFAQGSNKMTKDADGVTTDRKSVV